MPHYNFKNKETDEEFTLELNIAEREIYLKDNPHVQQILSALNIGDPLRMGITQPPKDFSKYVLGKVANMPGANKGALFNRWQQAKEI